MSAHEPQQHCIRCHASERPAILERILQTVRVRGFHLQQMQAESQEGLVILQLAVEGCRDIVNLVHQIEKLADVKTVELLTQLSLVEQRQSA